MAEHKVDELTATGTHRAWTGETPARSCAPARRATAAQLARSRAAEPNPRHAAITRSLYSWSNYKSWTDKVRSNWDKDKTGK